MVSLELFVDRSSVGPASQLELMPMAIDRSPENSGVAPRSQALQLGSVGALVVLGVLGGAGTAQAAVRRGAACQAVNQLQTALGERGYSVGAVDGKFGGRTEAAVRRFQKQQRLSADGIVGPATAQAIGLPPEFSCSLVAATAAQEPVLVPQSGTFSVATNGRDLRLRRAPAGPVVGAVNNGASVTVIETANGWAKLRSGAWVSRAWLQVGGQVQAQQSRREAVAQAQPSVVASEPVNQAAANQVEAEMTPRQTAIKPQPTTVLTAIPGQIVQLSSKPAVSPSGTVNRFVAAASGSAKAAVPLEVTAAPIKTGKIAISLPQAQPIVQSNLSERDQLRARAVSAEPATTETTVTETVVAVASPKGDLSSREDAVLNAVTHVASVSSASASPALAAPESQQPVGGDVLTDALSDNSLGVDSPETDSRAILVAAVSDSSTTPQASAPELVAAAQAVVPKVTEPARSASVSTAATDAVAESEVAESEVAESEVAASEVAASEVAATSSKRKTDMVAVRMSQQAMEVSTYGDRLLVRDTPAGQVIGSIANGVEVSTIAENDGWYELESGGWVMARWLRR